ncbi:hypothetical protein SNEBB_006831, partial [Seison nebaliae]
MISRNKNNQFETLMCRTYYPTKIIKINSAISIIIAVLLIPTLMVLHDRGFVRYNSIEYLAVVTKLLSAFLQLLTCKYKETSIVWGSLPFVFLADLISSTIPTIIAITNLRVPFQNKNLILSVTSNVLFNYCLLILGIVVQKLTKKSFSKIFRNNDKEFAIELNRIKNEQLREVKLREQIKENDVDIRNLQSQLRAAYTQKQRAIQIAEKEARHEALAVVEKQKYGNELKEQLEEKHKKARLDHEEFLREKKIIDDIVQFMEQKRIEKFRNIIELRRLQQKAHSDVLANAKEKTHQKLSQIIEKDQQKKEELEAIRQELYAEEQAQAADIQDEEALEKKLRRRIELQMENAKMLKYREQQRDKQKEQDAQIRRELLAKFAEDDRLEQMNQQKARMRREEHKRAAEQILIDRREERLRMKKEA